MGINGNGDPFSPISLAANAFWELEMETSWSVRWANDLIVLISARQSPAPSWSSSHQCPCNACVYPQRRGYVCDERVDEMENGAVTRVAGPARVCWARWIVCGVSGEMQLSYSAIRRSESACASKRECKSRGTSGELPFDRCGWDVGRRWYRDACLPHGAVRAISQGWSCDDACVACGGPSCSMG